MSKKLLAVTMAVMLAFGIGAYAQQEETQRQQSQQDQRQQDQIQRQGQDSQRQSQPQSESQRQSGQMSEEQLLTMLHTVNLKEIELAKLATSKSDNADVLLFAVHLLRDHRQADKKVKEIAEAKNVELQETIQLASNEQMSSAERLQSARAQSQSGQSAQSQNPQSQSERSQSAQSQTPQSQSERSQSAQSQTPQSQAERSQTAQAQQKSEQKTSEQIEQEAKQLYAKLERLEGEQFDREYVSAMAEGHKKALSEFNQHKGEIQDAQIKQLCEQLEPTLRIHAERAEQLSRELAGGQQPTERERT